MKIARFFALAGLLACRPNVEPADSSEGFLLPNGEFYETNHDGGVYRVIAEYFEGQHLPMQVTLDGFKPAWPLNDTKTAVLNRFGTPIIFGQLGYYHTGLAVLRSSPAVSTDVVAPHDGLAVVFDWMGNKISEVTNPYATIVAVYDRETHVVTQMMHVAARAAIASANDPVLVHKGDVIGKLAPAPISGLEDSQRLASAQLVFVDGENKKILNPARLLVGYHDTVAPELKSIYVTNEARKIETKFKTAPIDIIVEAVDSDDDSKRNLEVSAIAFTIKDQAGNIVAEQPRCELDHLYESIGAPSPFRAKELVDFGTAKSQSQIAGAWPNSDIDNARRTFRYALTQLKVENDRCTVLDDAAGALVVTDPIKQLTVSVTVWDAKGNQASKEFPPILRLPGSESRDSGADAAN